MLFKNLYTWIKYKTLPQSFLFKNRLFLERNSQSKRILNNFTWTFRSSKWTGTQLSTIPMSLKYFFSLYVLSFVSFILGISLFFFFYKNFFFFWFFKNFFFFFWFSLDLIYYIFIYISWLVISVASNLVNLIYWNNTKLIPSSKTGLFNNAPVKLDCLNVFLTGRGDGLLGYGESFLSTTTPADSSLPKLFRSTGFLNFLMFKDLFSKNSLDLKMSNYSLILNISEKRNINKLYNGVNFFDSSFFIQLPSRIRLTEDATSNLMFYNELLNSQQLINKFHINLQQFRWLYKYSLLHRGVFKNSAIFNKNFLNLDPCITKSSFTRNLWLATASDFLQVSNLNNLQASPLNLTFSSFTWYTKRAFFFNSLPAQGLIINNTSKNVLFRVTGIVNSSELLKLSTSFEELNYILNPLTTPFFKNMVLHNFRKVNYDFTLKGTRHVPNRFKSFFN
jgi:hypothetical protein